MNLINEEVTHKVFGEGKIVDIDESIITVDFNKEIKNFVYPDAFGNFITLNDRNIAESLKKVLLEKKKEEEELQRKREKEKEERVAEQQRKEKLKNLKIHESSQIVFWLDEKEQQEVFNDWQVFTGTVQSGKNKGQPNKVARLRPNSASILTVRGADQPETKRKILGLFMVKETFTGDLSTDGMVPAHAEYRIELTEEEAEKMLFWDYYINHNYPDRTTWNSGKFRYFNNMWTAQILKDIIALKTDEQQIKEAQNFLEYFCKMNAIDMDNIPEPTGALKQ